MKRLFRATQWVSRSSLRLGVVLSLLVHLLIGAWLALRVVQPQPPVSAPTGEMWFTEAEPPPPPPTVVQDETPSPTRPERKPDSKTPVRAPMAVAAPAPSTSPSVDSPRADAPTRPTLVPSQLLLSETGTTTVERPRGETVRPDDPRFDPAVIAAREKALVTKRVVGWSEDELAEARAQRGLPHPYLVRLGETGRAGLGKLAAARGVRASGALVAKALSQRLTQATESYGKTGNPDLGPPGQAPRLSEKLTQPDQQPLRALAQATETLNDLSHGKPLLTLTLELRQTRTNQTRTVILKASIDPGFDAFVLEAWPQSIAAAGPPPADAFRTEELRTIWEIEGWPGRSTLDKTLDQVPEVGVLGVPLARLIPATTGGLGYEFRARLLRAY